MDPNILSLPNLVVGPADVSRLNREIDALDNYLRAASLRQPGGESPKLPKTSRVFDAFVSENKLNMLLETDRERARQYLEKLLKHAPVIHLSFAADPSAAFVDKIITWLRASVHPGLLLRIGLQPTIAAGCVLRTPNHYYDFSMRRHFAAKRNLLIEQLEHLTSNG